MAHEKEYSTGKGNVEVEDYGIQKKDWKACGWSDIYDQINGRDVVFVVEIVVANITSG